MMEDFNIKQKDKYYLLFIAIFSTLLVVYYINFNNNIGIYCSDVYVYLLNAKFYAGNKIYTLGDLYLSPMICFITSLFFKLGFYDKNAIYIVTGAFAIFGNIGFYLLLKRYFNETLSLTGTIIYSSSTLYLTWLANGSLDIPAISMTIWIVLFALISIKDNPKFYTYVFALFVLGFFTRYNIVFILPALVLYYIYENGFKIKPEDRMPILKGLVIGLIIGGLILGAIMHFSNGEFGAGEQIAGGIGGHQGSTGDPAYNHDESYYLMNLPNFISSAHTYLDGNPVLENPTILSGVIFTILIIGTMLWLYDNKFTFKKKDIIPVILALITIATFTHVSSVISIILALSILFLIGKDSDNKIGYFMLGWILSNLIFYSYYDIKVNRYILPIFPPLIYLVLRGITIIHNRLKINENIIPTILIVAFIIQAFAFTSTFDIDDSYISTEEISKYIIDNNPDYENMDIGCYNVRPFRWWIDIDVVGIFSSNEKAIDASDLDYYISNKELQTLTNFTKIKDFGSELHLYKRSV